MAIRKEQVLLLLTLGVGALVARSLFEEGPRASTWSPKVLERTPAPVPVTALVTEAAPPAARRDICTEPSETRPLPPRALDFPPQAPLSVAALPLHPGPDFGHLWPVQIDGATVDGVVLQTEVNAAAAAPAADGDSTVPAQETPEDKAKRLAKSYDRIFEVGKKAPFWGTLEWLPGQDPYDIEKRTDFSDIEIHLRPYSIVSGKFGPVEVYKGKDERRIEKIVLAETLRHEVMRRVHATPETAANLNERRELVYWLLDKAREATWIYDVAIEQAKLYSKLSKGDLDGWRLQQRVLQARGDFAAEFALLDGVAGEYRESAFRYEGLGILKARLQLFDDAEIDLRRAVELSPTDGRPNLALAEFLSRRGRAREAVAAAQRVEQTIGSLLDAADVVRAVRVLVECHLAVGDIAGARMALGRLPAGRAQPYLEGCVAHAAGTLDVAAAKFQAALGSSDNGAALLGQAACLLRAGDWQKAYSALSSVVDQEPLLRHRACTGLALLFLRIGQLDNTLVWVDRALEADPQDPYAYYLRGRALRLQGQLGASSEALGQALKLRDDFVHAIAEMATLQAQRAREGSGEEQAQAAVAARRYSDRAVQLVEAARSPSTTLYERQGLHAFGAADSRAAGVAFAAARDLAAKDEDKLWAKGSLAIVDYSRGLVDDAQTALQRIARDLPKESPLRVWAESTLAAIDDHAQKEMLADTFDRSEVGTVWNAEREAGLTPEIRDKRLVFRSAAKLTKSLEGNVWRDGAVAKGKNFLAVGVTMRLGKGQPRTDGSAGLRIEMQRGAGAFDVRVQIGVREGKPFLEIEDGRTGGQEDRTSPPLAIAGFDPLADQELELRVVPRGDPQQSKAFTLQVRWGDVLVHQHELKSLTGNSQTELKTLLFAGGSKGNEVDVAFDDYVLERRKDR